MKINLFLSSAAVILCHASIAQGYSFYNMPSSASFRRTSYLTMKRGRGSFKKEIMGEDGAPSGPTGMGSSSSKGLGGGAASSKGKPGDVNWLPIDVSNSALPKEDGEIVVIDTNLFTLKNGATNPTGAVCVARDAGQTYCFSTACPQCKIPLLKAKMIKTDGQPVLSCSFCKNSYSLKTGKKTEPVEKGGILGGVANAIFSAQDSGPLPIYKLAEKNGKLLIALK